jgi:TPR repeat protein
LTALEQKAPTPARAGLTAAFGALAITAVALFGSMGFLRWRSAEQRRVLDDRSVRCKSNDIAACDLLRSACIKRSGDGCVALADAYAAPGPNHDPRESLRLLDEACTYRSADACLRAAKLQLAGGATPKNPIQARSLVERGCELGNAEACSLKATIH